MEHWFALSAIGPDRTGIVADLSELVYDCDCNLADSCLTILDGEFAVLLLSGQSPDSDQRPSATFGRLEWEKRPSVFFRPLEEEPLHYGAGQYTLRYRLLATDVNEAGIVTRVSRYLVEHGANIVQMYTTAQPEPGSRTVIYNMRINLNVPSQVDKTTLHERLDHIADYLHIHIDLTPVAAHEQRRTA